MIKKKCKLCGKEFEAENSAQMYCSTRCKRRKNQYQIQRRKCAICGSDFIVKWKGAKTRTCSKECARKLLVMTRRERMEMMGYGYSESNDPTAPYHSESLDRKVRQYGFRYGQVVAEETLRMVGGVDVEGILKELNTPRSERVAKDQVVEIRVMRKTVPIGNCAYCGKTIYDDLKRRGRPKIYCGAKCNHRAYMLRRSMG